MSLCTVIYSMFLLVLLHAHYKAREADTCDTPSMKCTNIAIAMLSTTSCSDSDGKQYSLCFCSTECLYTYSMMLANYTEYCNMHD